MTAAAAYHDTHPAPALVDPVTALSDPQLLAPMLPGIESGSWDSWLVVVRGLYGLPMTDGQAALWRELTDREPPSAPLRQAYALVGRRGGKTDISAALTLYETCLRDWSGIAAPGERIVGAVVAADRRQAGQAMRYLVGGLEASPMLCNLIERQTTESVELSGGLELAVMTASHRSIRGRSFAVLVADELGHWYAEGASPDAEILRAAEPSLSLTNGLLLGISTPHRRDGVLYSRYKRYFGKDDPRAVVVQAPSRRMNPRLPQSVVDSALAEDEPAGRSEYLAEWRDDLASFVDRTLVDSLIRPGLHERPRDVKKSYRGFVDVSGGRGDSFTWAIAHDDGQTAHLDLLREVRSPFDPSTVVEQCAEDMRRYGLHTVRGDRYAAEFVTEAFRRFGIKYEPSERTRSEIYLDLLPRLTAGQVELLDHDRLVTQLCALERKTRSGGRDLVDHPRGGADDVANAAAGALVSGPKRAGMLGLTTW